jgi:hypothetical protein
MKGLGQNSTIFYMGIDRQQYFFCDHEVRLPNWVPFRSIHNKEGMASRKQVKPILEVKFVQVPLNLWQIFIIFSSMKSQNMTSDVAVKATNGSSIRMRWSSDRGIR